MKAVIALMLAGSMLAPGAALADTLYQAGPPAAGTGHPLHLGPDHKAQAVGDLVYVVFNFAVTSTSTNVVQNAKSYNVALTPGTGNLALGPLRFPASIGGQTGLQTSKTSNGANSFSSAMMATVVNILPSGVMEISGLQHLKINGADQIMKVTGYVRPEDIDTTDAVPSSRIANVEASFSGDFQEGHKGLIRKILDFLF